MLLACSKCHRQYDVSSLETGARIRCYCGEMCTVPDREPQDARMVHCASCGGRLVEDATHGSVAQKVHERWDEEMVEYLESLQ